MILPTKSDGTYWYERRYELEGVEYVFEFYFNARLGAWFLDIATDTGEKLVTSVRLIPSWPLLNRYSDTRLPPGALIVNDTSGTGTEPGLKDLSQTQRCQLQYFTLADLGA